MLFFACGTRNDLTGICPSAKRLCPAILGGHGLLQLEGEPEPHLTVGTGHTIKGHLFDLDEADAAILELYARLPGDEHKEVVVRRRWSAKLYRHVVVYCRPVPVVANTTDALPLAA